MHLYQYIVLLGVVLWALQYLLAAFDGSLFPSQMLNAFPNESILPLLWHWGIAADFPLTIFLGQLVFWHPEWPWWSWIITVAVGSYASWFMHANVYAPATKANPDPKVIVTQESHVQRGDMTVVAAPHIVFFAIMFAVLLNEGIFSKSPTTGELEATVVAVFLLLFVGNHMVLGIVKALTGWPKDYRAQPLTSPIGWATVFGGTGAALALALARMYHLW